MTPLRLLTPLTFVIAATLASCEPPQPASPLTGTPTRPQGAARRWSSGRRDARDACHARDFAACRTALLDLYSFSGSAQLLLELGSVEAHSGDQRHALEHLRAYAATGLTADLHQDSDLAKLAGTPEGSEIDAKLRANRAPIARATVAFDLPHDDLVTEGVAWDPAKRTFLVSSVRKRKVVAVDEHGAARDYVAQADHDVGALCGMATTADALWVAMATMPPMVGYSPAGAHPQALLRYDLATGAPAETIVLPVAPQDHHSHALTDVAVGPSGDVFVSDAEAGGVYVVAHGTHALAPLVPEGVFVSPQTPAPTPDGTRLLVPDYVLGIASVDLATRAVTFLPHPAGVALEGIDDLHLVGTSLIAVQNGTTPVRIVRFALDPSLSRVESFEVLEQEAPRFRDPTHGVLVDGAFYFLNDAGWDRFAADGSPAHDAPADAPKMMRLPL